LKQAIQNLFVGGVLLLGVATAALADIEEVDNQSLEALMAEGVAVIDVRRIDEWQATGVIDGAHTLTFFDKNGRYDAGKWLAELEKIAPKGTPVVLICEAGVRSKNIADLLDKQLGYTGIHNHTKGMRAWRKADKPVVKYP